MVGRHTVNQKTVVPSGTTITWLGLDIMAMLLVVLAAPETSNCAKKNPVHAKRIARRGHHSHPSSPVSSDTKFNLPLCAARVKRPSQRSIRPWRRYGSRGESDRVAVRRA